MRIKPRKNKLCRLCGEKEVKIVHKKTVQVSKQAKIKILMDHGYSLKEANKLIKMNFKGRKSFCDCGKPKIGSEDACKECLKLEKEISVKRLRDCKKRTKLVKVKMISLNIKNTIN